MESDLYYEKAIECALNQIEISKKSARLFNQKFGPPLPVHQGFKRLVIQLEKDKDYQEAIDLCMRANKEEWNGDWEKESTSTEEKTYQLIQIMPINTYRDGNSDSTIQQIKNLKTSLNSIF